MRKLFLKIALIVVLACTVLLLYAVFIRHLDDSYTREIRLIPKAKIISIGSSEGLRLKWGAKRPEEIANLCLAGADLFSAVEVLNSTASHFSPDQLILLEVNNASMYQTSPKTFDTSTVYNLNIHTESFYNNLPSSFVTGSTFLKYVRSKALAVNGVSNVETGIIYLLKKILPSKLYRMVKTSQDKSEEQILHIRPEFFDRTAMLQKEDIESASQKCMGIREKTFEALKEIKKITDRYHLTLIAYSCPKQESYLKAFGLQLLNSSDSALSDSLKKLGIPYFDNLQDKDFLNRFDFFYDSVHLNKNGARVFDNKLFKDIYSRFPQLRESLEDQIR